MRHRLLMLCSAFALLAAACGGGATETTTETDTGAALETETAGPATEDTSPADGGPGAAAGATVAVASSDLGDILVDGEGRTLYLFLNDEQGGPPTCYDDCASNWPPLVGEASAGEGSDGTLLATVERDDGSTQVTYNGWPLYYFAADQQPGDTNGQGVGDVWFVVDPAGEAVREAEAASADGGGSMDSDDGY